MNRFYQNTYEHINISYIISSNKLLILKLKRIHQDFQFVRAYM